MISKNKLLDKCEAMTLLCTNASTHWSFIKFCFNIPITDKQVENLEFYKPDEKSEEIQYIKERRKQLGGFIPTRRTKTKALKTPANEFFESSYLDSGDRELSTTMALVSILTKILRDKEYSSRLVPIIPDEARTF